MKAFGKDISIQRFTVAAARFVQCIEESKASIRVMPGTTLPNTNGEATKSV